MSTHTEAIDTGVDLAELVDAETAATITGVSAAHFKRMSESGRAPRAIRLGRAIRWQRQAIIDWIKAGCPRCK